MKNEVLLQHGWAYDPRVWEEWLSFFPTPPFVSNQGYFSPAQDCHIQRPQIIITHSLGLHFLSEENLENCKLLVILSGFQEFHPGSIEKRKFSVSVIEKMLQEIKRKNEGVLTNFYQRALRPKKGKPFKNQDICWKPLERDLQLLNENTLDLSSLKKIPKILVLHGEEDAIVPVGKCLNLTKQLPNSEYILIPHAGHALILTHPNQCWTEIQKHWPMENNKLKTQIAHSFSRCAAAYHEYAFLQKDSASHLLSLLPVRTPEGTILEIGCGTGFVTEGLLEKYPQNALLASDIAPGMVQFCKRQLESKLATHKAPVNFAVADGEDLPSGPYSLIVSGLTVQWFEDLSGAITKLFKTLKTNGSLSFSFMEDKSFPEWKKVAKDCGLPFTGHPLPKAEDIASLVKSLDCDASVTEKAYPLRYNSPKDFFSEFKKLGTNCTTSSTPLNRSQWIDLFKEWQKDPAKEIESTYSICYVTLKRKNS
ncbi:MAG: malonyl-CoA O-methyltransferase [Chlamydiales bacterium]|jgi:malonyl-CoA O-methyltransferase